MLHAPSPAGRWGKIKQMGGLARVKHLTNSTSVWKTYSCSLTLIWLKTFTLQRDEEMLSCILNMTAILWLVGEKFVCAVVARWMNQFGNCEIAKRHFHLCLKSWLRVSVSSSCFRTSGRVTSIILGWGTSPFSSQRCYILFDLWLNISSNI